MTIGDSEGMTARSVLNAERAYLDTLTVNSHTSDLLQTAAPEHYAILRNHLDRRLRELPGGVEMTDRKNPTTDDEAIFALFELGYGPLEVSKRGFHASAVMRVWRQWSEKAVAAQKRLEGRFNK